VIWTAPRNHESKSRSLIGATATASMPSSATTPSTTPPGPPVVGDGASRIRRVWKWLRYVLGLALAGLAIWAVAGKSDELAGASQYLGHLRWGWAVAAAVAEALSFLCFANMQRQLIGAGGVDIPIRSMSAITLAGNSIQNSLPAGLVLSSAYAYRQFRRWGADEVLSGWVVIAMGVVTILTLSVLAAVGLGLAASAGTAFDLVGAIVGVVVVMALIVLAWVKRTFLIRHAEGIVRVSQRITHRPRGDPGQLISEALVKLATVAPTRRQWAWATSYAMGNWLSDLACLALSFLAIGAGIPWRGLLLAYTGAQLATDLPVTPGGLGVVEGSLTVALVAFGGRGASTVAAVLVYRLLNYWLTLPIGWGAWGVTVWAARRDQAQARGERRSAAAARPEVSGA